MIKGVIFDLDGTLLYTLDSLAVPTNKVLNDYGFSAQPLEKFRHYVGDGIYVLLRKAFAAAGYKKEVGTEIFDKFKAYFAEDCDYKVKPYDTMPKLLSELKEKGIKLACNSNKPQQNAEDIINKHFPHTFDFVAAQTDGVPKKPDKTGGMKIAQAFKMTPDEILYVGDSDVDMICAANCGFKSVGAAWGYRGEEELRAGGADYIAYKPIEVERYIK